MPFSVSAWLSVEVWRIRLRMFSTRFLSPSLFDSNSSISTGMASAFRRWRMPASVELPWAYTEMLRSSAPAYFDCRVDLPEPAPPVIQICERHGSAPEIGANMQKPENKAALPGMLQRALLATSTSQAPSASVSGCSASSGRLRAIG
ncbi:hypothetical protein D3C81_1546850 [compost metagenome]